MSYTDAIKEAYAYNPVESHVVQTLELIHPAFVDAEDNADSVRIALDEREWDLEIETGAPLFAGQVKKFEPLAMEVTLPEQTENDLGGLKLALDNIPRSVWTQLQAAATVRASASVIYREWVATRDTATDVYSVSGPPDLIINQLTMRVVTATRLRLEGTAKFADLLNKSFPRRKFDRDSFPGLFGG